MWKIKTFKTKEEMEKFIKIYGHKIEWKEIFVNNGYAIEYRILTIIKL